MKKAKTAEKASANVQSEFRCPCGGKVKMVTQFRHGIKYFARCVACGRTERRPSDF